MPAATLRACYLLLTAGGVGMSIALFVGFYRNASPVLVYGILVLATLAFGLTAGIIRRAEGTPVPDTKDAAPPSIAPMATATVPERASPIASPITSASAPPKAGPIVAASAFRTTEKAPAPGGGIRSVAIHATVASVASAAPVSGPPDGASHSPCPAPTLDEVLLAVLRSDPERAGRLFAGTIHPAPSAFPVAPRAAPAAPTKD